MKRLKGPQLKMPELKAPAFLGDLYYDLRDRRLLPLILLVVVAIVAVPFLLGDQPEETLEPAGGGILGTLESGDAKASSLTVVEAQPGLRDYHKRLHGQQPVDPFKQRYTSSSLKGAELNEKTGGKGGEGSKSGGGEKTSTSTTNGGSRGGSAPGGSTGQPSPGGAPAGGSKPPKLTFFAFAINVRIAKSVNGEPDGEPIVREKVLPQTPLPNKTTPIVTYMGPARDGRKANGKALLLVSEDVREIAGDANCLSGDETCQLLEVEPGFPIVLGLEGGVSYTVNVLKLSLVVTGHS